MALQVFRRVAVAGLLTAGLALVPAGAATAESQRSGPAAVADVTPVASTTTLKSNANPATYGQAEAIVVRVRSADPETGPPTGTVSVTVDGTGRTLVLSQGAARLSLHTMPAGTHTVVATYGGDALHSGSVSAPLTQVIEAFATTTTLRTPAGSSVSGQEGSITATVSSIGGATHMPAPTGTVVFTVDGVAQAPVALNHQHKAKLKLSSLPIGTHTVSASYGGDAGHTGSSSSSLIQVVSLSATTTGLETPRDPITYGQARAIVAQVRNTVHGVGVPIATGTVTFTVDGATAHTVSLFQGDARLSLRTLAAGTHTITAAYNGDATHGTSVSAVLTQVVTGFSTVTTVSPPGVGTPGQDGSVTATVAGVGIVRGTPAVTGTVVFTVDGVAGAPVPLDAFHKARLKLSSLAVGTHVITATYGGDAGHTGSTSAPFTQVVTALATVTTLKTSANPVVAAQTGALTANVRDADPTGGAPVPTGTIVFTVDGVAQAPVPLGAAHNLRLRLATLTPGTHTVTATYGGDARHAGSVSAALIQVVQPSSTTTLASAANPAPFGAAGAITATVKSLVTGFAATGTVVFTVDGVAGSPVALTPAGKATLKLSTLGAGAHTITATYSGDGRHSGGVSAALIQTITATSSTVLATPANPTTFGHGGSITATVKSVAPATGFPTGTVTFAVDGVAQPPVTLTAAGKATLKLAALAVGSHAITATYGGDGTHSGSVSAVLTQVVTAASTTTTLKSATNPVTLGGRGSITATVKNAASGAGTPTGTVTFVVDGVAGAPVALSKAGKATLKLSTLTAGSHTIVAVYSGDTAHAGSTSTTLVQVVNP